MPPEVDELAAEVAKFGDPVSDLLLEHVTRSRGGPLATGSGSMLGALRTDRRSLFFEPGFRPPAELRAPDAFRFPPLLFASWERWIDAAHVDPTLIAPGSPADRIAEYSFRSGPWLGWLAEALQLGSGRRVPRQAAEELAALREFLEERGIGEIQGAIRSAMETSVGLDRRMLLWLVDRADEDEESYSLNREDVDYEELVRRLRVPPVTAANAASYLCDKVRHYLEEKDREALQAKLIRDEALLAIAEAARRARVESEGVAIASDGAGSARVVFVGDELPLAAARPPDERERVGNEEEQMEVENSPEPFVLGPRNHILLKNGRFVDPSTRSGVHEALDRLASMAPDVPLVVHFHGGLVSSGDAADIAGRLGPEYGRAGAHPFFFVWNSDLTTTLRTNMAEIAGQVLYQVLVEKATEWVVSKITGGLVSGSKDGALPEPIPVSARDDAERKALSSHLDSVAERVPRESVSEEFDPLQSDQMLEWLKDDPRLTDAALWARDLGDAGEVLIAPEVLEEIRGPEGGKSAAVFLGMRVLEIAARVVRRYVRGRDHGLYTTIVEEVLRSVYLATAGGAVWAAMKKDTADAFGDDPERHGGTAFVDALDALSQTPRRIVLVGHSTGAIYITNLLRALHARGSKLKAEVVFLAPAATFKHIAAHEDVYRAHVSGIRMFGLVDEAEAGYWEVPGYSGSLLYLVSGLFEDEVDEPLLGMQRFWSPNAPFSELPEVRVANRLIAPESRVWSPTVKTAAPGYMSAAKTHGDFDNDPACIKSVAYIIANGIAPKR